MKIMSLEEIENLFEKKSEIFHNKMVEFQKEKLQPLTFKLIMKYSVDSKEMERKLDALEQKEIANEEDSPSKKPD